jgi:large subunit ribosomal protein L26e
MKTNPLVSQSRRTSRRNHFSASSSERRIIMSAPLSKKLREQYNIRSLPVRKGDTVRILVGSRKIKGKEAKIKTVYRKKYCINLEKITREKVNGTQVDINIHPSNVELTTLHIDKNRKDLIARKAKGRSAVLSKKGKSEKVQEVEVKKN